MNAAHFIANVLKSFSTQAAAGGVLMEERQALDPSDGLLKVWVLLRNAGASAIAASQIAIVSTTDQANGYCRVSTTATGERWAGVRPVGTATYTADSILGSAGAADGVGEFGWFIKRGVVTLQEPGDVAVGAAGQLIISGSTAGKCQRFIRQTDTAAHVAADNALADNMLAIAHAATSANVVRASLCWRNSAY